MGGEGEMGESPGMGDEDGNNGVDMEEGMMN